MAKYFIYGGAPVKCPTSTGKRHDKFMADNDHLIGHECTQEEYDSLCAAQDREARRHMRRMAYANGDYIDSLMKQFNLMRLNGTDLCEDMDASLAHWLKVKQDIPID